jgi:hypothetical protein
VTECRYDRDADAYLTPDGEPCDTPRREHCTARKTCSNHLQWGELTCATCLLRTRTNIRRIAERAPLLLPAALESRRIDSEAANLAGPAADVEAWSWRKVAAMQGVAWHQSQVEDDDDFHPYTVLTRWAHMLAEDFGSDEPEQWTVTNAANYLDRVLHRVANSEDQDFRLLAHEVKTCRNRVDSALSVRPFTEQGERCTRCEEKPPRLRREYGHWCDDPTCEKVHLADSSQDIWRCPKDREHWWSHKDYTDRIEARATPNRCA